MQSPISHLPDVANFIDESGKQVGQKSSSGKIRLYHAEKSMLSVALAAGLIDIILIVYNQSSVDWVGYLSIIAVTTGLIAMGFFYRISGRSERIGSAAICASLFIFFSLCLSMFNYQLLPLWREPVDWQLNAIDQLFGYHWPTVISWASQNLVFSEITRFAYMSTIPQFAAIVVILGLSGRIKELHILILSITITATFTICFWGLFPAFGPSAMYQLPLAMEQLVRPEADTAYGRQLVEMSKFGPGLISPKDIKGLVAFPSYHIVLACTAVYAARTLKWVLPVYLVLNALIVPGIFIHGGHHLIDLPAGIIVAATGIFLARKAINADYRQNKLPDQVAE